MAKRQPACSLHRRDILKAIAAGTGLAFLPTFGLDRVARAGMGGTPAQARNLLVVNCVGALRSSAAFYASTKTSFNPYGVIQSPQTPFPLGRLLDDYLPELGESPPRGYQLASWNGLSLWTLRDLAAAGGFSILNTWDPGSGDHVSDRVGTTTGDRSGGAPGLLTRLYAGMAAAHADHLDFPAFHIDDQGATFGKPGGLPSYVPVTLSGPSGLPGAGGSSVNESEVLSLAGNDWAADATMRGRLDQQVVAKRAGTNHDLAQTFALHRATAHSIGGTLAMPAVNVANTAALSQSLQFADVSPGGGLGQLVPLTNQMLYDAFTNALGVADPTSSPLLDTAMNAAIAVRLLQLGSRGIVVNVGNFDSHSGEKDFRPLYLFLGRLWGALAFVLSRVPDPVASSKSLLDTTLVCTMSEFGRDEGGASGFNAGFGTDHGSGPATWSLAHAVMGSGVKGGRVFAAPSTNDYRGDNVQQVYDAPTFLATCLSALGVDTTNVNYGFPDVTNPLPGLWT